MDKFCIMLVPSMHCIKSHILIVTIVEMYMLILDVCVSLGNSIYFL